MTIMNFYGEKQAEVKKLKFEKSKQKHYTGNYTGTVSQVYVSGFT